MAKDVPLNVQVPLAAGGAGSGYGIGKIASTLLFYYILSADTPDAVKLCWEILLEGGLGTGGAFLFAWLKGPPKA